MSDFRNDDVTPEKTWPFEEVLKAGIEGTRAQRRRFQAYVAENDPSLAAALAAEEARFDSLVRTAIEPAMRDVAEQVARSGWHVSVVRDDDLDRLDIIATPGIRFYCSRRPILGAITDFIWPPCFIAFYGCARLKAARTLTVLSELDPNSVPVRGEPLEYPSVTRDLVRSLVEAFVVDLDTLRPQAELP